MKGIHRIPVCAALAALLSVGAQAQTRYLINGFAGNGTAGFAGDGAASTSAQLNGPVGLAFDSAHNLYIADQINHRIRMISASDHTISTVAGTGTAGYSGDGAKATAATLNLPVDVVLDSSGNIYIADSENDLIRKISGGNISTVAGNYGAGFGFAGDGGAPLGGVFNEPTGLAVDSSGNLYISDTFNSRIREVLFSATKITTVAGDSLAGSGGIGGIPTAASLKGPRDVAIDSSGRLYISDSENHRILVIANNIISIFAGNGTAGFSGDGGLATKAQLNHPLGIAFDSSNNLYIADSNNSRIRMVSAATGNISTIAGSGLFGYGGDTSFATDALLNFPAAVLPDNNGNIYIADTQNNAIRVLTPIQAPIGPPTISSGGVVGAAEFGALTSVAPGSWIEIYGNNLAIATRQWAYSDFRALIAPTSLNDTQVLIGSTPAFVDYVSSNQINALIPSTVAPGTQQLTVQTDYGTSAPYNITINPRQAGVYAPAAFRIGGKQYAWAILPDGTPILPPGSIAGTTTRQAKPGETIVLYGIGFGPVTPAIAPGMFVSTNTALTTPLTVLFGNTNATLSYAGLAPGFVGLYQFNVTVPNVANSDLVPITFSLGGAAGPQTLYTAVHN
ncbi:MAG TPA: IPT/TIG domain-containing protein [Bryobacteraceae bacterium]|jgi:uncharacterized protein (TIGR03437 family)